MTIQWLSSKRIEGLDAEKDTLPVNFLEQGYSFTSLDIAVEYIWNGVDLWIPINGTPPPTFAEDFTVDNFVDTSGINFVDTANTRLDWTIRRSGATNDSTAVDIQTKYGFTLDSSKWVVRFPMNMQDITIGAVGVAGFLGITDLSQASGSNIAQDGIGLTFRADGDCGLTMANGAALNSPTTVMFQFNQLALQTYYVEIKRDGDIATLNLFNNPDYSNIAFNEVTANVANVGGLNYFAVKNNASGTLAGDFGGFVEPDLEFFNGISELG